MLPWRACSRRGPPLASGLLGLAAGGRADTTIILLDCSPSMQQREAGAGLSKLAAGRRQLAETLATLGSSHWVLIDSTTNQPHELPSPGALADLSCAEPTGAEADLPAMLEAARTYMQTNQPGAPRSGSAPTFAKNDCMPIAAGGGPCARALWGWRRASASIYWPTPGGNRQHGGARHRHPPATVR